MGDVKGLTAEGSTRAWRAVREYVLRRDDGLCQVPLGDGRLCLAPATTVDHILPRSRGGGDAPENLRAACHPCNKGRGNDIGPHSVRQWGW